MSQAPSSAAVNDPMKFAYWVPNVGGGLVVSKIQQRTDWGIDYNRKLAQLAENNGFEYAHGFGEAVKRADKSTHDQQGMWANSNFEDLVQYHDGFKTGLIGTPVQIAGKIVALKSIGVNLVLRGFLHYLEDVAYFGRKVLPLRRDLERLQAKKAA